MRLSEFWYQMKSGNGYWKTTTLHSRLLSIKLVRLKLLRKIPKCIYLVLRIKPTHFTSLSCKLRSQTMPMSQKKIPRAAIVMQVMQNVRIAVTTDTRERFAPLETLCVIRALKEVIWQNANALIDTGSTLSHLSSEFSKRLNIELENCDCSVGLAVKSYSSKGLGKCTAEVKLNGQIYNQVSFTVLEDLLTDVILGQDFMNKHQNVNIHLGGPLPTPFGCLTSRQDSHSCASV